MFNWNFLLPLLAIPYVASSLTPKQGNVDPPKVIKSYSIDSHLMYHDRNTAVYYSKSINQTVDWPFKFFSNTWRYMKRSYGPFGKEGRLYVVFTSGKSSPGTIGTAIKIGGSYLDNRQNEKNVIEFSYMHNGGDDPKYVDPIANERFNTFNDGNYGFKENILKYMFQITDGMNGNTNGAGMSLWYFDNIVNDFFISEIYANIKDKNAKLARDIANKRESNFPTESVFWNKNLFFQIFNQGGKEKVVQKWYKQLTANWPRVADGKTPSGEAKFKYSKETMNYGECVHFWSGALGKSVKEMATKAWGEWDNDMEKEYQKAKEDFPGIKYDENEDEDDIDD